MSRDFFDPTPEQQNVTLIEPVTLREAERQIISEHSAWNKDRDQEKEYLTAWQAEWNRQMDRVILPLPAAGMSRQCHAVYGRH